MFHHVADDRFQRRRLLVGGLATLLLPREGFAATPKSAADGMAEAELRLAEQRGELCSAKNATGTGLRGEYFAGGLDRGAPLLVRTDATVDFDRTVEWPAAQATRRPSAVRWTGWVKPPTAGRYRFHTGQASARLWVSQKLMAGEGADPNASLELAAGRFYPVRMEAERLEALDGRVRLEWTAPHGARYLIPRALMFLPNESVPAAKPAAR